jgi:hypothetical protein
MAPHQLLHARLFRGLILRAFIQLSRLLRLVMSPGEHLYHMFMPSQCLFQL